MINDGNVWAHFLVMMIGGNLSSPTDFPFFDAAVETATMFGLTKWMSGTSRGGRLDYGN